MKYSIVTDLIFNLIAGLSETKKTRISWSLVCKFFCITLLILFFIFIIVVVSLVLSQGRTIFGSI